MRIDGKKPNPVDLADIVQSMDTESSGFGDTEGTPVPVPAKEPVVTSPAAMAVKKKTERRKKEEPVVTADPSETPPGEDPPSVLQPQGEDDAAQESQGKLKPVIEHGIPIPAHGNVGAVRYPFRDMKAGDSFFVKQEPGESRKKLSARVRSASAQYRRRSPGKVAFTTRMEKNGIRVWRTT